MPPAALRAAGAAFDAGADPRQLLRECSRLARAAELVAVGFAEGVRLEADEEELCRRLAAQEPDGFWLRVLEEMGAAELELRQPVDARLQVEACLLRLCRGGSAGGGDGAPRPARGPARRAGGASGVRGPGGSTGGQGAGGLRGRVGTGGSHSSGGPDGFRAIQDGSPRRRGRAGRPRRPRRPIRRRGCPAPTRRDGRRARRAPPPVRRWTRRRRAPWRSAGAAAADAAGDRRGRSHRGPRPSRWRLTCPGSPDSLVTLEAWQAAWPALIEAVNRRDRVFAGVLRGCRPLDAGPDRLVVGAPYDFHLKQLGNPAKRPILAERRRGGGGRTA